MLLISSYNKDETISSKFKVDFVLLFIATTRLSKESNRENNKLMHLSSSSISISTKISSLARVLKTLRWSVTESPYSMMRWYSFFHRNNFFTRDFHWYKFPSFSHSFFGESSLETFNNTKSERKRWIVFLAFLCNFFQSFDDIGIGFVLGFMASHCSLFTRRSPILSFHSSKFYPLNFSISTLELLSILSTKVSPCKMPLKLVLS